MSSCDGVKDDQLRSLTVVEPDGLGGFIEWPKASYRNIRCILIDLSMGS
jgi:hypothetical protein